ncbi:MAG TPA: CDP-alcohol phosphatidyltransferase family protein [Frankiaceae bacterium]|nr:CDP-alcohol phosphatidyltransferase family protein [Frankiaceae bacterium]
MTGLWLLLATGVGLGALAAATARPPAVAVPDRDGYFARWAGSHGGYDPRAGAAVVRLWLGLTFRLGRPLARRGVLPGVVTLAGAWVAAAVLPPAAAGGRWPLLAAAVVVASALLDNLDGCVAVLSGRATAWGYVLDSLVDRACDVGYLVALWLLGAPGWVVVAAGGTAGLLEYARARAAAAGFDEIGVVTVGERPTRVIVTAVALCCAGLVPARADLAAGLGAGATLGVCAVGLAQLLVVVRRGLLAR